jgi:hypothetical protein
MQLLGYLLIAAVVAAVLFYCVIALLPDGPPFQATRDDRPFELPADRRMVGADVDSLRIPVALRGYRFAETDALIDRLGAEIAVRDQELARLRGTTSPASASNEPADTNAHAELAAPPVEVEPGERMRDV